MTAWINALLGVLTALPEIVKLFKKLSDSIENGIEQVHKGKVKKEVKEAIKKAGTGETKDLENLIKRITSR